HPVRHPRPRRSGAARRPGGGDAAWPPAGDRHRAAAAAARRSGQNPRLGHVCANPLSHLAGAARRRRHGALRFAMVDVADHPRAAEDAGEASRGKHAVPRWVVTVGSLALFLLIWEVLGRRTNPIFGAPPSEIFDAFIVLVHNGKLATALLES